MRDIAGTLLACPFEPQDPRSKRASNYLQQFAAMLSRLDGVEIIDPAYIQKCLDAGHMPVN